MEGGKSGRVNDGFGAAGADQLMADIVGDLGVRQAGEGVMDGNTLAQGLVDRFAQGVVEIRLTAEDESKAVDGVITVIHKHFNIVEDSGGEILRLVHRQQEGLAFFFVEMKDLVLDCVEHARLTALGRALPGHECLNSSVLVLGDPFGDCPRAVPHHASVRECKGIACDAFIVRVA